MKHQTLAFRKGFRITVGNGKSQGAVMVLAPGESEGGPEASRRRPVALCDRGHGQRHRFDALQRGLVRNDLALTVLVAESPEPGPFRFWPSAQMDV